MSPYLILLGACVVSFVLLLKRSANGRRGATDIAVTGLASINIVGALGLGWFVVETLFYDGVMIPEILGCIVLMSLLAGITAGGLALKQRGKIKTAIGLLSVGAAPTIFVYGFLVYLEFNPIDWR